MALTGRFTVLTVALGMGTSTAQGGNLLPASSFDRPEMKWSAAGKNVTAEPDPAVRHSTGRAWHVVDRGPQMGQSNSPLIPVDDGQSYFVKLWVRIDPAMPDKVVVDVQSFLADRSVRGGAITVATLKKTQRGWVRAAKIFRPRAGAKLASIRVMPAAAMFAGG